MTPSWLTISRRYLLTTKLSASASTHWPCLRKQRISKESKMAKKCKGRAQWWRSLWTIPFKILYNLSIFPPSPLKITVNTFHPSPKSQKSEEKAKKVSPACTSVDNKRLSLIRISNPRLATSPPLIAISEYLTARKTWMNTCCRRRKNCWIRSWKNRSG